MKYLFIFLFFCSLAFGQGVILPTQQALKVVNGVMSPVSNATITVCAASASGIPCAPALVSAIFKDAALTQPLTNPFTSDANGNYVFAIAPGNYTVTVSAAGFAGYSYQTTAPLASSASNTFSGTNTFNGPTNLSGGSLSGTFGGSPTFNGSTTFTGNSISVNLNNVIWICNVTYACTDAGLQAAVTALCASGGSIRIPPGQGVTVASTIAIGSACNNIDIAGMGPASSIQVNLAGDVFTVAGARFRLHDMEIGLPTTTRTGAIIRATSPGGVSPVGAAIGSAYNLDIIGNVSSTNNGFFFTTGTAGGGNDAGNVVQWDFDRIYMPRGTTWTAAFKFVNSSATASASTFAIKEFRGGGTFTDAGIVIDGAIDTLQIIQSTWNNDSGTGKAVHVRNTVGGFFNPRFIFFDQVSLEAVDGGGHTSTAVQIDAGKTIHYYNGYCATTAVCFTIGASALDTDISHNGSLNMQIGFANVASGALRTIFSHNQVTDSSLSTDNGQAVFQVAANATDVTLDHNSYSCNDVAHRPNTVFQVVAGTGDRIKIYNNSGGFLSGSACFFASVTSVGGSGLDIQVTGNGAITNSTNIPIKVIETAAPNAFANQDICYGDSTAHAMKCSYNNGTFFAQTQTIASGTATMTTAAIAAGACGTTVTVAAANVATTDTITWAFNAAPGGQNAGLVAWPTSGNVNFAYCSNTAETPAAATINWRVVR